MKRKKVKEAKKPISQVAKTANRARELETSKPVVETEPKMLAREANRLKDEGK